MFNTLDAYREAGRKAAIARNNRDEATAQHWHVHHNRMRNLESPEDKRVAQQAYDEAYREARRI